MKTYNLGAVVSKGYGIGKAFKLKPFEPTIINDIKTTEINLMQDKFIDALLRSEKELNTIIQGLSHDLDKALIFEAHLEILNDISIKEMVIDAISNLTHPSKAIIDSFNVFKDMFEQMEDPLIKERIADLKDVSLRLLRNLEGLKPQDLSLLDEDVIILAHDLLPSDTATMNKNHVKGILTEIGSKTSHSAIIARSLHIPAILGIHDLMNLSVEDVIIVDAVKGVFIVEPTEKEIDHYQTLTNQFQKKLLDESMYLDKEANTLDKQTIELMINIGSDQDEALKYEPYVDGVGLFRSEFLYMSKQSLPTFDEQVKAYQSVSEKMNHKKVILRTLDIGGDKTLTYLPLPKEENPFLGKRALRLCLDELDIFKTQIKAALVANIYGNIDLMIPMVGSIDDIIAAKHVVETCKAELEKDKIKFNPNMGFGIMIEIPSIALLSDKVAQIVDFASIGTNDLTQYLMAVDRMNANVSSYYQSYAPALFRLIKMVAEAFNKHKKPLSVCGELGGDQLGAPVLIGLGIKKLSMSASELSSIKRIISKHTVNDFSLLAHKVIDLDTEKDVIDLIKQTLNIED